MSRLAGIALAVAGLLAAAPGAGAAGWITGPPLSPPNRTATVQQLALLPSGERIVSWLQLDAGGQNPDNISVRVAPPGADFGPIQTFPATGFFPILATGRDGTAVLVWNANPNVIHIARRVPGATSFVDHTVTVPITTGENGGATDALVNDNGDVYVAATSSSAATSELWVLREAAGSNDVRLVQGPLGAGAAIDAGTRTGTAQRTVTGASLATDGTKVSLVWAAFFNPGTTANQTSTLLTGTLGPGGPDGTFSTRTLDFLPGDSVNFPQSFGAAIAGGAGHTYVVWTRDRAPSLLYQDLANPGLTLTVPGANAGGFPLDAGVDGAGTLISAWDGFISGSAGSVVSSLIAPAGIAPPAPARLTSLGVSRNLDDLAVAPDGTALALVDRQNSIFDPAEQVQARLRAPGGAFGPPEEVTGLQDRVSTSASTAVAAVGSGGHALALWTASDHSGTPNLRLFLSERDATPPALAAIGVPATTRVGDRVDLSASATDSQSATTVAWDFGDGSHATGALVSHVFGTAGPTTVTVTATDAVGNTTSQTRGIAVAPAPVTPPADRTAPVISGLTLTHARFRVGSAPTEQIAKAKRKAKPKPKKAPVGTTLRLKLSERATLAIEIAARSGGRSVSRGTFVRASAGPGAVAIAFSGRIGRSALAPGAYRATVTALDGAGNRSLGTTVGFTVSH